MKNRAKPGADAEDQNDPVIPSGARRGVLYVVGTPIGNLEDVTLRALRILKEVDLIACEDTRWSNKMLDHYGIKTPTISYHGHNEMVRAQELLARLEEGTSIALVTDAGTPVISDPGFQLIRLAIRREIPIVPVPGPSALVVALAAAGLPADKFLFVGFLPAKTLARRRALVEMKSVSETLVLFEAPHRIIEMLEDAREVLGDREAVLAREVTKIHEEFVRGSISHIRDQLKKTPPKGEITVVIGPRNSGESSGAPETSSSMLARTQELMVSERLSERDALKKIARELGISKSEAYRRLQMEKNEAG
jgi:16S rRNA (cytidine1402-2'-O)-methyltransferase